MNPVLYRAEVYSPTRIYNLAYVTRYFVTSTGVQGPTNQPWRLAVRFHGEAENVVIFEAKTRERVEAELSRIESLVWHATNRPLEVA